MTTLGVLCPIRRPQTLLQPQKIQEIRQEVQGIIGYSSRKGKSIWLETEWCQLRSNLVFTWTLELVNIFFGLKSAKPTGKYIEWGCPLTNNPKLALGKQMID